MHTLFVNNPRPSFARPYIDTLHPAMVDEEGICTEVSRQLTHVTLGHVTTLKVDSGQSREMTKKVNGTGFRI